MRDDTYSKEKPMIRWSLLVLVMVGVAQAGDQSPSCPCSVEVKDMVWRRTYYFVSSTHPSATVIVRKCQAAAKRDEHGTLRIGIEFVCHDGTKAFYLSDDRDRGPVFATEKEAKAAALKIVRDRIARDQQLAKDIEAGKFPVE